MYMRQKKALVALAEGFEEIEAITVIDILRRSGISVTAAGVDALRVKGAHGVCVLADELLDLAGEDFDAIVLPGGSQGAFNLAASQKIKAIIKKFDKEGKVIAAICAAPSLVLAPAGILKGRSVTGYPGMLEGFGKDTIYKEDDVVVDANIITSRGPATAFSFGLAIAEKLAGRDIADKVRKATLAK
jgi:4-methyl-5(b-hydroxyethyl)-thiazole monophosphate biosynthesis